MLLVLFALFQSLSAFVFLFACSSSIQAVLVDVLSGCGEKVPVCKSCAMSHDMVNLKRLEEGVLALMAV